MRANGVWLAICSMVLLVALGCGPAAERSEEPLGQEPAPGEEPLGVEPQEPIEPQEPTAPQEPAGEAQEQVMSGEITKVDVEGQSLWVKAEDAEHTISFSDETEIIGAAGAQGLAGREGARVTVHYQDDLGTKRATRIVLEGGM